MKILFLGDVVGRAGRQAVCDALPGIRKKHDPDFILINGENATGGMGLGATHAAMLLEAGADLITLGDHAFDQKDMHSHIEAEPRIIRPLNIATKAPGRGHAIVKKGGKKLLVITLLGQVFMRSNFANPFIAVEKLLEANPLGQAVDAIFIEIHAEATSEKMAMGCHLDGRVSAVIGTHTHVPTADHMILPGGTAYQSDAGMCGVYTSVIGMEPDEPLRRFLGGLPRERFTPARGEASLCGALIETGDDGLARRIAPFRMGGHVSESLQDN